MADMEAVSPSPDGPVAGTETYRVLRSVAEQLVGAMDARPLRTALNLTDNVTGWVPSFCSTARARRLLQREGAESLSALSGLSVADILTWRQCGRASAVDILVAVQVCAVAPLPSLRPVAGTGKAIATDLTGGYKQPEPVIEDPAQVVFDTISEWARGLQPREQCVLAHRVGKRSRTLDEIGAEYSVSRERIRQIERTLIRQLRGHASTLFHSAAFDSFAALLVGTIGELAHLEDVVQAIPAVGKVLAPGNGFLADLLPVFIDGVDHDGDWLATSPLSGLVSRTVDAVADPAAIAQLRTDWGLAASRWSHWLSFCELAEVDGQVVRANASIPERAVVVLRAAGEPMTAEAIAERIGADSVRSLKNRLLGDSRFVRTSPSMYGLPEWRLETYEGIREEIVQRIDRAGGQARLSDLIDELVSQFNVSANSVYAYASGREFVRHDGWIMLAGDGAATRLRRARTTSPDQTRRCFLRDGRWWVRVDINRDTLRGSGFAVPTGVMGLMGVPEGTERVLSYGAHEVRVSWQRLQPVFGSLRPILLELGALEGDALWLTLGDGNELLVRHVRSMFVDDQEWVSFRCGLPRHSTDSLQQLMAQALGLDSAASWDAIVGVLRGRGDLELADALEAHIPPPAPRSVDVEDLFAALRGVA